MAIHGYPGGFKTTATPTVTTSSAPGIWTKISQLVYQAAGSWPSPPLTAIEYLVVAGGGGGGGQYYGGGGGAGGYRTATDYAITLGTAYTVTVGNGGAGGYAYAVGVSGGVSSWNTSAAGGGAKIESAGGGGGASYQQADGSPAGSGGSGGGDNPLRIGTFSGGLPGSGNTPSTSPVQGYNGGTSYAVSGTNNPGGGGGAGAVGMAGNISVAGDGGIGRSFAGTYYGGGGGAAAGSGTQGAGGTGGGANGVASGNGNAATANTGGGGGGSNTVSYSNPTGGSGGSGIVIIRYADTYPAATSTTGSPTITVAGGYRVYKWTGSGSITI